MGINFKRVWLVIAALALTSVSCNFVTQRLRPQPTPLAPATATLPGPEEDGSPRLETPSPAPANTLAPADTPTLEDDGTPIPADAFFITGVWEGTQETPRGSIYRKLELTTAGEFTLTVQTEALTTVDRGEYALIDHRLHLTVKDHEPKEIDGEPALFEARFFFLLMPTGSDEMLVQDPVAQEEWTMKRTAAGI